MSAAIQSPEQERDDPRKTTAPPPRDSHEQRTSKEAPGWFGVIFGSDSSGPAGLKTAVTAICIVFSLFHLYTAGFGALTAMLQRNIHLTFAIVLIFLIYPFSKEKCPKIPRASSTWCFHCLARMRPSMSQSSSRRSPSGSTRSRSQGGTTLSAARPFFLSWRRPAEP